MSPIAVVDLSDLRLKVPRHHCGSKACGCGRTISANRLVCRACAADLSARLMKEALEKQSGPGQDNSGTV